MSLRLEGAYPAAIFALAAAATLAARGPRAYHLSAGGDDARSPAQAARAATPWRSLARLDSVELSPGDSVLLRRGDVFPGVLKAARTGDAKRPIVYGAYGRGLAPVVSGTVRVQDWAPFRERIFAAAAPGPVVQLFLDGKPLPLARHPNRGYLPIGEPLGDSAFRAAPLPPPAFPGARWDGAGLHLKSERFSLDARVLDRYEPSGIFHPDRPANYRLRPGRGFFLNGTPAALDTAWEWAYDAATGRIYLVVPEGDSLAGHALDASVAETGFRARGTAGLRIEGLRFFGTAGAGIKVDSATDITIRNCAILYPGAEGLELSGSGFRIESDTVEGAIGSGIRLYGGRSLFSGNRVHGTGRLERLGRDGFGGKCCRGNALEFYGDGNRATRNRLSASAECGIRFEGADAVVEENLIDSALLHLDDAGGIYTWARRFSDPGSAGSRIRNNLVLDVPGSAEGNGDTGTSAIGIYVDESVHDVLVEGNTVAAADIGIYLHDTRNVSVRRNTCFGNRDLQLYLKRDYFVKDDMSGNRIAGNLFFAPSGRSHWGRENLHGTRNEGPLAALGRNYAGPWGPGEAPFSFAPGTGRANARLLVHDGAGVRVLSADTAGGARGSPVPAAPARLPRAFGSLLLVGKKEIPFPE